MTRRLLVCATVALLVSCATGHHTDSDADRTATNPSDLNFETTSLVQRAEALRDRNFETPPTFQWSNSQPPQTSRQELSTSAHQQGWRIARFLFDLDSTNRTEHLVSANPSARRAAHYRPDEHAIWIDRSTDRSKAQLRRDILFALVVGLNHQNHPPLDVSDAKTWDETLGRLAAAVGPASFVETAQLADNKSIEAPLVRIAEYPELFDRLRKGGSPTTSSSAQPTGPIESPAQLRRRLGRFLTRQGFAMTAALYRAGRWSATELPFSSPPTSTADVTRPDRWIQGAPTAKWSWPDSDGSLEGTGVVGPATTVVWLEQQIPAPYAATLYNGYESDTYRIISPENASHRRFEWVSMWNTPAAARQVAAAFDRVLQRTLDDEHAHTVLQGGLKVAVVITENPMFLSEASGASDRYDVGVAETGSNLAPPPGPDASSADATTTSNRASGQSRPIDRHARDLLDASARFLPRDGLPVEFKPTRRDEFQRAARKADLADGGWTDPATGLDLDLQPIQAWQLRTSSSLPLRWLASAPDGAILQWSTTLQTPLDPAFGTTAYRQQLKRRLAEAGGIKRDDIEFESNSLAEFSAVIKPEDADKPQTLIWQYLCGDAVHSASLGLAKSSSRESARNQVETILKKATDDRGRLSDCRPTDQTNSDTDETDGTIDIEMHD